MDPQVKELLEAATQRFVGAGTYAWHFARGKLQRDPVFFALLRRGLLPDQGSLLDLGCGQGILLTLLSAAKAQYQAGRWPREWPVPPRNLNLQGIERRADRVQAARHALGGSAQVILGDLREFVPRPCSVIVILDVLLYLGREEQPRLLDRVASALEPGGLLLLREADASAGFAFRVTEWTERIAGALRGQLMQPLHYRGAIEWIAELAERGFAVGAEPMSEGTPFANVLYTATKRMDAPEPTVVGRAQAAHFAPPRE
jgi:trans-aconitate methyltransferase